MSDEQKRVVVYDTTLRDGCQAERVNLAVEDKLHIARLLDDWGVPYIEGGWPNETAPRDREFFERAREIAWKQARIVAFGSTRKARIKAEDDSNLQFLAASGAPTVAIFGKAWDLHVTDVLRTTREENLAMIEDSVRFLKSFGLEVLFDAEHFFDGFKADSGYAMDCLRAAVAGGADWLVPCDTNGGSLPHQIFEIVAGLVAEFTQPIGIHCHDDGGMAVANSIEAVRAGASLVQGTINGYGERTGNANLCTIIPNLELKLGVPCLPEGALRRLYHVSRFVDEIANLQHEHRLPYVGESAFAHKGGAHVNAVLKNPATFEHIDPEVVGNERRVLVSDYSGTSTMLHKLQTIFPELEDRNDPRLREILMELKRLEGEGYEFEAAEASFELMARRLMGEVHEPFQLLGYRILVDRRPDEDPYAEATIKVQVGETEIHTAADGTGPVHALDRALRKALGQVFPKLESIKLVDYKVRVLEAATGTSTKVRALVTSSDGQEEWGTVGAHDNIIEASWQALVDSMIYGLIKSAK